MSFLPPMIFVEFKNFRRKGQTTGELGDQFVEHDKSTVERGANNEHNQRLLNEGTKGTNG
jgi:hypothetical protein